MHILGKISAWLIVIAAGAALGLTVKLHTARNAWMKQVADLKASNEKNAAAIELARKERSAAEAALAAELVRWDRYWTDVPAAVVGQGTEMSLTADIGTTQLLGSEATPQPVVYAFQIDPNGNSIYVGPFQVVESRENQSALKPKFRVRPDEPATWTAPTWRFRAAVPDAAKARFLDLESQLMTADERLLKDQSNVALQTQLVETAKQHRDFRVGELLGSGDQQPGLVAKIDEAEATRDEALSVVDSLRRQISDAVSRLNQLAAANKELMEKLSNSAKPVNETADARRR